MNAFYAELKLNLKRRMTDGFAIGYNVIFPIIMILLLGTLCKGIYKGEISSFQYYAIVVIPFSTLMGIVTAAYAGKDDAYAKVAQRIMVSPIAKEAIVMSKVISCTMVFSICSFLVFGIMAIVTHVLVGRSLIPILVLLGSISFCISALGTMIGLGMKNFFAVKNIMTIPICLFAIVGGTFFPIGNSHSKLQLLINLSPLTWINKSLFLSLYDHNQDLIWWITLILLLAGTGCMFTAMLIFQKEEYLYGDLPGHEE